MGTLKFIFTLSIVLILCTNFCSSLACREGSISWNGVCLNMTYISSSDISANEICSNYPNHCTKKIPYYFKCPQTPEIQNPVLIEDMCVDESIAYCYKDSKLVDGLCTYSSEKIRRIFLYTLDMDTLDLPSASEYKDMKESRKRRFSPFYPGLSANGTWSRDESPGISSQLNFLKTFHFFKHAYPNLRKLRVQIIESTLESEKDIDYSIDPLSRWLGISINRKTGNTKPKLVTNLKFQSDLNILWELNEDFLIPPETVLPAFYHMMVERPLILPLLSKTPPQMFIPSPPLIYPDLNTNMSLLHKPVPANNK